MGFLRRSEKRIVAELDQTLQLIAAPLCLRISRVEEPEPDHRVDVFANRNHTAPSFQCGVVGTAYGGSAVRLARHGDQLEPSPRAGDFFRGYETSTR